TLQEVRERFAQRPRSADAVVDRILESAGISQIWAILGEREARMSGWCLDCRTSSCTKFIPRNRGRQFAPILDRDVDEREGLALRSGCRRYRHRARDSIRFTHRN